jgi:hypothetical protein
MKHNHLTSHALITTLALTTITAATATAETLPR